MTYDKPVRRIAIVDPFGQEGVIHALQAFHVERPNDVALI